VLPCFLRSPPFGCPTASPRSTHERRAIRPTTERKLNTGVSRSTYFTMNLKPNAGFLSTNLSRNQGRKKISGDFQNGRFIVVPRTDPAYEKLYRAAQNTVMPPIKRERLTPNYPIN